MLGQFFKRLLIGAAAAVLTLAAVHVARKIFSPKKVAEVASEEVAEKAKEKVEAKAASKPAPSMSESLAEVLDLETTYVADDGYETNVGFAITLLQDFLAEFPDPNGDLGDHHLDYESYFDYYAGRRRQGLSHREALEIARPRLRLLSPETLDHIDRFQALAPLGPYRIEFDGIFDDDFMIPGLHSRSVPPLRSKTLKMRTAGTREFHEAYAYLGGEIAQAYLEPIGDQKTTVEEDHAIQCRARLFDFDQPMDIDKWQDDMFDRRVDEDKYLDGCQRILIRSPRWLPSRHRDVLPHLWDQRVLECLIIMQDYAGGFRDEAKDRFKLYLAAVIKTRNRAWGLPGSDVSLYIAPALFRYAVSELRRLIWVEESLTEDEEPFTREEIAKEFEYFLNLITIPNPLQGDILRHTRMKLVKALTLDMTPVILS